MHAKRSTTYLLIALAALCAAAAGRPAAAQPPDQPVRLVFIHHSCGENWLADGYGGLGLALGENNYFVSDTNYGWGPDAIGDRTDIPDWMEWFRSAGTPEYMAALLGESGQHADYTRALPDPGGENRVVMFKSCFPNSDLSGSPGDPPGSYAELSVGGAKYVYNQLLEYFATRPEVLFVAVTAPPLSDPGNAANARAFNTWLVNDWLREAGYDGANVAVFDFYNVLTGPGARHTFLDGGELYVRGERDTLYYPSGDDHPSAEGSRKATAEFVPLLNHFYRRWQAGAPVAPAQEAPPAAEGEAPEAQPVLGGMIDGFEVDAPPGTNGWEPFWDEATPTSMHCAAESGAASAGSRALLLDFDVAPGAWATCALFYESAQDWSGADGLAFSLRAEQAGLVFNVDLYAGSGDQRETYVYTLEAPPESAQGWIPVALRWEDFRRAGWEENAGAPFASPERVAGLAFGFETYEGAPNTGRLWVDELALAGAAQAAAPPAGGPEGAGEAPVGEPRQPDFRRALPCGAGAFPLALAGAAVLLRKKAHAGS